MEWYENKFLFVEQDLTGVIDDFNTAIIHMGDPLCVIRIVREDRRGPNWRDPKGIWKEFEHIIPAKDRDPDDSAVERYMLWIFRPEHIPPHQHTEYQRILDQAWRYYMGSELEGEK